ncbi:MAG: hypothetical protein EOM56_11730 [Deltaproteobacteria bacterium]|nr:hypothetical protein [Deltaproteobacteria bacterium]
MNPIRCACLLLIALLAACGAQKRTVLLPPYQAESPGASLVAQFGARLSMGGQSAPVQGEVQMTQSGGSLALILPHGRTLGVCTYSANVEPASAPKGAAGEQSMKMECTPAEGLGREAASLLFRAGVAVYRILPALGQGPALPQLEGKGWSAHFSPTADGLNGTYGEQDGMTMDMYFVEISHL